MSTSTMERNAGHEAASAPATLTARAATLDDRAATPAVAEPRLDALDLELDFQRRAQHLLRLPLRDDLNG